MIDLGSIWDQSGADPESIPGRSRIDLGSRPGAHPRCPDTFRTRRLESAGPPTHARAFLFCPGMAGIVPRARLPRKPPGAPASSFEAMEALGPMSISEA